MLRRNVGGIDRVLRVALGFILLPTGLFLLAGNHRYALVITILGFVGLVTGITGFCVLYVPLSISTARRKGWMAQMAQMAQQSCCQKMMKEMQSALDGKDEPAPSEKAVHEAGAVRNEGR